MASREIQRTRRPTIGLLLLGLHVEYEIEVMEGAAEAARDLDVNLLSLVGGGLSTPQSAIYDLTSKEKFDGLIAGVPVFQREITPDRIQRFLERFAPLPVVGYGLQVSEFPTVLSDGYSGMYEAVTHLVKHHDYRQIAFLRAFEGHFEGDERYRAYTDVLAENNIFLDPDLVATGNFTFDTGRVAMQQVLDTGKPIQAVVAANDNMAMGAIAALRSQGFRIPDDVAIVGFDDSQQSRYLDVPLTTVRQSVREVGYRALQLLLESLSGTTQPDTVFVPTELIVRRSCGCMSDSITQAAVDEALSSLVAVSETLEDESSDVPSQVWEALLADVSRQETGKFLRVLDDVLREVHTRGDDLSMWGAHLSVMRRRILAHIAVHMEAAGEGAILHAENLLHQAQILVSDAIHRIDGARALQLEQRQWQFQQFDMAMATVLDLQDLGPGMTDYFPGLGVECCYLSLFAQDSTDQARLLLTYEGGDVTLTPDAPLRPATHLIVLDDIVPSERRHTLIVEPLSLRNRQLGFVHFEYGTRAGHLYDRLAGLFSGAIFRALMERQQVVAQQEIQRRASLLMGAAEISRAASSITDLDELLARAVTLIKERFALYYVGIFLSDENQRWAVLVAGTGEAGRTMLARGHKLEIAQTSMIGSCVVTGAARVTFDVTQAEVHRKNPVLPDTRSEMALPLVSRDQVIGAMTIQSTEPGAFSQEDITVLQTMADQLANAIENARLIDQMEQSRRELEMASGQYTQESWQRFTKGAADSLGYRYRLVDIESAPDLHAEARAALEQHESVLTNLVPGEDTLGLQAKSALGVPIRLRNQVLGVLNLRFEDDVVPAETVELIEQIADRLATSLESARLLQETRRTADREQMTSRVTSRMRESLEVDAVVKTAVDQIREVMDLSSVTIRLAPQESGEG